MGFIQSLLRQRKLLNSLAGQRRGDFAKPHQSLFEKVSGASAGLPAHLLRPRTLVHILGYDSVLRPRIWAGILRIWPTIPSQTGSQTFEQLEPRQLYSVTPASDLSESLGITDLELVAYNGSGQFVAAWNDTGTGEFKISAFKSDGTSLVGEESSLVVPSIENFVTVTDIAFNGAGRGVIAGVSETGLVALQFTISNGELVFAQSVIELAGEALPADQMIGTVDVAIDGSGNFTLAWISNSELEVAPASGVDLLVQPVSSVYMARYDDTADTFGNVKAVWEASAKTGSYTTAGPALDIEAAPDGSVVVAWSTLSYTFKANPDFEGEYDARPATYATQFARYGANLAIIGAVTNVSSQSMSGFDSVGSERIEIVMGGSGAFIVGQSAFFSGVTETGDDVITNEKSVVAFRSFSNAGKALSGLTTVAQGTGEVSAYTFGYGANGNIVALWTATEHDAELDQDVDVLHSQTYTNAGAKVGNTNTLDIGVAPVMSMVLVTTGETYQLLYSGTETESGEAVVDRLKLQDLKADLVGEIDGGTLPSTLTIGKDITGTLNITLTNIGGYTYSGTASIKLTLSADDVLGNEDDVTIISTAYSLNIAAGAEKMVTLSGIKIGKTVLPADADGETYTAFVSIDAGAGNDMNTANNVVSTPVLIAAPNSIKDIASDDMIVNLAQAVLVPGDTGTATVIVRNTGNTDLTREDVITVEVYARSADDPDGEGILIGTKQIKLNLAAGATTKVTFSIKISDDLPAGQYNFSAVVAMEGDSATENDTFSLSETRSVVWDFGNVEGRKGLTKLVLTEEDGSTVTFSLTGSGKGTVTLAEEGGYNVTLSNTTVKTSVTLGVKGGEDLGWGALHSIVAEQDVGSISAANFTFSGDVTLAWIKTLVLGDLTPDATHTLTIESESTATVASITLGHAAGLTLNSSQAIGALSMLDTGEEGGAPIEINAVAIDSLKTKADKKRNSVGDFSGDITLTGKDDDVAFVALKSVSIAGNLHESKFTLAGTLKSLSVTGSIDNSVIRTTGNISAVSAESLIGSSLLAGVADSVSDSAAWPTSEADFANHSTVGSVTLKGTKNESHDFIISGFTVGTMKLGRITSSDGGTYGVFVAQADPATPKVKPFGSVSFSYLPAEATKAKSVSWSYKSTFVMPASVEDVGGFVVAAAPEFLP